MVFNSQTAIDTDLDNFMLGCMLLGVAAVTVGMSYVTFATCKDACKDLYDARPLTFRRQTVLRYPIPQHIQSDPESNAAIIFAPGADNLVRSSPQPH